MRNSRVIGLSAAAALTVLAACTPIVTNHGYAPTDEQLAGIVIGQDTMPVVNSKIGLPTTGGLLRQDVWYYVASTVEAETYHAPKVIDRRVVAVRFDNNGVAEGVDTYGLEDGRVINLVTRTTPTYGRELSVLQQLFGNIGRVGPGSTPAAGPAGPLGGGL